MTLFRLWVSKDGYYISEAEAVAMGWERAVAIVCPYTTQRLSISAPEEELSAPVPYHERLFIFELLSAPDGPIAEQFAAAIEKSASLLLQTRKLQPYRYGEITDHEWELIDRGLKTP